MSYRPMRADGDPLADALADQCDAGTAQPMAAEACTDIGAEEGLTLSGWAWAIYLSGMSLAAICAGVVLFWR